MVKVLRNYLVVLAALVALSTPLLQAQSPVPSTAPTVPGRLTIEELKQRIENMGYEILKEYRDEQGNLTSVDVKLEIDTWTASVNFSLSPDKSNIWCNVLLLKVPDPSDVPAKVFLGLLNASRNYWPVYFTYYEQYGQFEMSMFIPNSNVDAKVLRERIKDLNRAFRDTAKYWNPNQWS